MGTIEKKNGNESVRSIQNKQSHDQMLLAIMRRPKSRRKVYADLKSRSKEMTKEQVRGQWEDKLIIGMKDKI